MNSVNYTFFLSLAIIILGYFLKRIKIFQIQDGRTLSKLIFNLTLPAVILNTIPQIEMKVSLIVMPIICIIFSLLVLTFSIIIFHKKLPKQKGILLLTVIAFNVGNFAYPLVEGIWGEIGLQYIAMFDVGNAFVVFVISYIIGAIFAPNQSENEHKVNPKDIGKKVVKSIPLMCYIIALGMNVFHLQFPTMAEDFLEMIARVNQPIVLLTLGIFLDFNFEKAQWKQIIQVVLIRYIFGISVGLLLYFILPFDHMTKVILFVGLILPLGMATITYAVEFKYDEKIIGTIANITIIISFILMWLIIAILGT